MNFGVNVCGWCPAMDWDSIQGVFLHQAQSSQDKFWIHLKPDQDNLDEENSKCNNRIITFCHAQMLFLCWTSWVCPNFVSRSKWLHLSSYNST